MTRRTRLRRPAVRHALAAALFALFAVAAAAQELPELTQPVNDFAHVVDAGHADVMDRTIRALQAASGDVIVVASVATFAPYGSIEQYAVKLFENHGRGIGVKGKDNGVLVVLAVKERRVWIEVGYGLEPYITDGFAGETSRLYMIPEFRRGDYGAGLEAGVQRLAGRIAEARGIALDGVPRVEQRPARRSRGGLPGVGVVLAIIIFIAFGIIARAGRGGGGPRRWGGGPWSGWTGGMGGFGGGWGGFGGGFGGGGGGGGFGGFGGGSSGGGGGGGGW